jgi:hypothetical protein
LTGTGNRANWEIQIPELRPARETAPGFFNAPISCADEERIELQVRGGKRPCIAGRLDQPGTRFFIVLYNGRLKIQG